jgi:uncharacterized integral membrane protein (TIGR00697 family)
MQEKKQLPLETSENNKYIEVYSILCSIFALIIVISNLTYQKFISIDIFSLLKLELSVGAVFYPAAFIITDLISEIYGKEKAKFCVKLGLAMNILAAIIIFIMDKLPATDWSKISDANFHNIFGFYSVSFMASIIACYLAQLLDIHLYLAIRKITKGKYLWIRNAGSTSISLFIDTFIAIGILTIFAILPSNKMIDLVLNSYLYKLFFTIANIPIFYAALSLIKLYTHRLSNDSIRFYRDSKCSPTFK